jgi:hypothetical protein
MEISREGNFSVTIRIELSKTVFLYIV